MDEGSEPRQPKVVAIELAAEVDTAASIESRVELAVNELRLAILALLISIGLGAAAIGLTAYGVAGGIIGGVGGAVITLAVLKTRSLRQAALRFAQWTLK
jgi:hypothetical protein